MIATKVIQKKEIGGVAKPSTNGKLIAALESEEKRLKDNELRYAEKIKSLTVQLDSEVRKSQNLSEKLQGLEDNVYLN
jgi:hypothetical protein